MSLVCCPNEQTSSSRINKLLWCLTECLPEIRLCKTSWNFIKHCAQSKSYETLYMTGIPYVPWLLWRLSYHLPISQANLATFQEESTLTRLDFKIFLQSTFPALTPLTAFSLQNVDKYGIQQIKVTLPALVRLLSSVVRVSQRYYSMMALNSIEALISVLSLQLHNKGKMYMTCKSMWKVQ